jgi:hypothetical protein
MTSFQVLYQSECCDAEQDVVCNKQKCFKYTCITFYGRQNLIIIRQEFSIVLTVDLCFKDSCFLTQTGPIMGGVTSSSSSSA